MRKVETGGQAGYVGYNYQILVSVWVALELMLARKVATEIEIEPASDEDIAAKLEVASPTSTSKAPVTGFNLQIQIKHRSSHWTKSAFKDVLNGKAAAKSKVEEANKARTKSPSKPKRKQTPRAKALAILAADANAQYLLITDAIVDAALRPFEVASLVERSEATRLPWLKDESEHVGEAPRIAILPSRTRDLLVLAIDKILGDLGSVPSQKQAGCREALLQTVRLRLLNKLPGQWTLAELQTTIERHGGYCDPGQSAVLPENYETLEEVLDRFNAVLITGSAGTGKTSVAKEMVRRRRFGPDAAVYVHSSDGLGAVKRALEGKGKYVFFVEDPWGKYEVDSEAALWSKTLPSLLSEANPNKQFIITTRGSVQQTAMSKLPPELARIEHQLQPEHYSSEARQRIFWQSFRGAKPWQRDWASRHLREILNKLAAPLALDRCAKQILDATHENWLSIDTLIKKCNIEVLADTFADEIVGRKGDAIDSVLALWAWQVSDRAVSKDSATKLRNTLSAGGLKTVPDVRKLHDWLAASGWWESQLEGLVAHPTVLAGAESLVKREPEIAERVFGALLSGLVALGDLGRALTIRQQVRKHLTTVADDIEKAVANFAIDSLLTGPESEWQQAFYYAKSLDLRASPVGMLLTFLQISSDEIFDRWKPPELTPADIASIRASSKAYEVARRWVLTILPRAEFFEYDGEEVAHFLRQFGFDFSDELFEVAKEAFISGHGSHSIGIVITAALSGPTPRYEEMLTLALESRSDAIRFQESNKEALRKADQNEIDELNFEILNDNLISAFEPRACYALLTGTSGGGELESWRWPKVPKNTARSIPAM